ncbi:MAG: glucoamylase family protein [Gemmatimonadales bacterium]
MLTAMAESAFRYFETESHPLTGLVRDSTVPQSHATIAGSGMALGSMVIGAERGLMSRNDAAERALTALRFLSTARTSVNGFFYHFLDCETGERAGKCEVSTIDSALFFVGALAALEYFDGEKESENEIRELALNLYRRADWVWMSPRAPVISHGWTPEKGFLRYDWRGYNEALLLYILALGSPTHAVSTAAYDSWVASYKWKSIYGKELLYAGPLFTHQMSHAWVDFRGIQDAFMRERDSDYFENSRRATYIQREYASRNPKRFSGYGENCWGVSASAGPGEGKFQGYRARGVPFGPDDGTISPLITAASLPFAPEIVIPALEHMWRSDDTEPTCSSSFNASFTSSSGAREWRASHTYAIDQGPVALMIENHHTGLIWNLLKRSPYIRRGLERAGFNGGWLT